jgi:tetratricopeptide (TPR) repeat protein
MSAANKCYGTFILVLFLLLNFSAQAQTVEKLIEEGDKYTTEYNNQKALDTYLKADKLYPDNWEVLWRISRAYVDVGENMPEKSDEQKDAQLVIYQKAFDFADKSVKLASDKSITYIRRAIANGRIALFKGVFSVAGVVTSVKEDCEKAIKLNNGENYTIALGHYILARTHAKISEKWAPARSVLGLGWADNETAIVEFNKAINLFPNFRMFYLDLAKSYIREDQFQKARDALKKVIDSPKKDEDDDQKLNEAKKLLEEIKNE